MMLQVSRDYPCEIEIPEIAEVDVQDSQKHELVHCDYAMVKFRFHLLEYSVPHWKKL